MITADFRRSSDRLSLKIIGHAGYSDGGADIVCAAVSGIFYALLGYIANECKEPCIKNISSGCADIECGMDGECAMKLVCIGLLQIALTYPGSVEVKNSIWNWHVNKPRHA